MNNYNLSTKISEAIIFGSFALFCTALMVCVITLALTAYVKPKPTAKTYVVQSAYIEVVP